MRMKRRNVMALSASVTKHHHLASLELMRNQLSSGKDPQDAHTTYHTSGGLLQERLDTQFTICQDQDTSLSAASTRPMLYKPHTPMELGDVVLGQLTSVLVFMFDHTIPAVHNVVSWEADLSPIVPEWAGDTRPSSTSKMQAAQPQALTA